LSLYVYQKHLENTLYILINSSIALKQNKKNIQKLEINPKSKNFMSLNIFFRQFKDEKKYLSETSLTVWNLLTPISIILVVKIGVNDDFLSLPLKSNNFFSLL
jgi:hypothetical protein